MMSGSQAAVAASAQLYVELRYVRTKTESTENSCSERNDGDVKSFEIC